MLLSLVLENEANGQAVNNNLSQAQAIGSPSFTLPAPANVSVAYPTATVQGHGGGLDVDFYRFSGGAGQHLVLDIDDDPFTFDTIVSVFDASGTRLTYNDDNGGDPGSQSGLDSFVSYTLPSTGNYYVSVSEYSNFNSASGNTGVQSGAAYQLQISLGTQNRSPVAGGDAYSTNEDTPLSVAAPGVLANDSDPDGDALTVSLVSGTTRGGLSLSSNGGFVYTPSANLNGSDSFVYRVTDPSGLSSQATVTINVAAVNDAPTLDAIGGVAILEDAPAQSLTLTGISPGPSNESGQALTITATSSNPALIPDPTVSYVQGQSTGTLSFAPAANAHGSATVTVTVADNGGTAGGGVNSITRTFTVAVTPVNDAPSFSLGGSQGEFRITGLLATGAGAIEDSAVTGDDRGGIAVSPTRVFSTGDATTGRFNLADLSGGVGVGRMYDGLVGNLHGARVYTLSEDGVSPITLSGGTIGSLIEIDADTGALTGNVIALSAPITAPGGFSSGVGLFSGYDRVVIYNGSRVYNIDLPSGQVTDLGAMSRPNWMVAESWAIWGVAEYFDGAVHLDYVRNWNAEPNGFPARTVVRTSVPDGATSTVATFANLGDMASFTVSLANNRWYFHYEGSGQFRTGDETIGYADATWTLSGSSDVSVLEDSGPQAIGGFAAGVAAGPADEAGQALTFQVGNDNTALFSAQPAIDAAGRLTFTPAPNASGSATVTVRLADDGGTDNGGADTSAAQTFTITVTPVNDAPSFVAGPNVTVAEDAGPQSVPSSATGSRIYWVNNTAHAIQSANLDGSDLRSVVSFESGQFGEDVEVDRAGGKIYWTEGRKVKRANLDGSGVQELLNVGGSSVANELSLDLPHSKLYYVRRSGIDDTIGRMNLDGTAPQELFDPYPTTIAGVSEITVDPANNKIYWTSNNGISTIERANLDGSGRETLIPDSAPGFSYRRLRLDAAGGKMYWTANDFDDSIQRANLDGTGQERLATRLGLALGFDIDPAAGKMYWANGDSTAPNEGSIQRANLDGTSIETLIPDLNIGSFTDLPALSLGLSGEAAAAGWATAISAGPADEAGQALTFQVGNDNTALFSAQPAIDAAGRLTFTPAPNASGSATVTVRLRDGGGTDNGGVNTSAAQTFTITVTAVADAPSLTASSASGNEAAAIPLNITAALNDGDGSELLAVRIAGLPADASLSAGVRNLDGSWTLTPGQLSGLKLTSPDNAVRTLTVVATATESSNNSSASTTRFITLTVQNVAPTATLNAPATGVEGSPVAVSLTSPTDPSPVDAASGFRYSFATTSAGLAGSYGAASPSSTASFTFADNGAPTIFARVFDKDGSFTTYTTTVSIANAAPTLTISGAGAVNEGAAYVLGLSASDPGADTITGWTIDWGDNTPVQAVGGNPGSVVHTYANDGTYTIHGTATDEDGTYSSNSQSVAVANVAPSDVALTATPNEIDENDTVSVTGTFQDPGTQDTHQVRIDWQDGSAETVIDLAAGILTFSASHQYLDNLPGPGHPTFTITASVSEPTPPGLARSLFYGGPGNPETIDRSALDGTGMTQVVASAGFVRDLAVDVAGGKIYWADATNPGGSNRLYRANLDGSGREVLATVESGIGGVDLDLSAGKVYFGSVTRLYRVNLDGSGLTTVRTGYLFNDVEVFAGKVYWTYAAGIKRANLDGTGDEEVIVPGTSGNNSIVGMHVEGSTGRLFWADQSSGFVRSSALDGTGVTVLASGQFGARGVAVDTGAGRLYWGRGHSLFRANLDGTDPQSLGSGPVDILSLLVAGGGGSSDAATGQTTVSVDNVAPTAVLANGGPVNEGGTATVSFSDQADASPIDTAAGFHYSYALTQDALATTYSGAIDGDLKDFSFTDDGSYTVYGRIFDKDGGYTQYTTTVTVANVAPSPMITSVGAVRVEGTSVAVTGAAADPAGARDTLTYAWAVYKDGDGAAFAAASGVDLAGFSFTPDDDGSYTIVLTVSDEDGGSDAAEQTIAVANVAPTPAIVSVSETRVEGTSIAVAGSATDPGALDAPTLAWAVYKDGASTPYATGDGASWSFTPDDNGSYRIVLTATDKDGDSTAAEQTIAVANVAPAPSITGISAVRVEGTSIAVSGSATDPGTAVANDGLSLAWAVYKDGSTALYATGDGESWSFTPDDNGSYKVVLTATDKDGDSTAVDQTIAVANVAPSPAITSIGAVRQEGTSIAVTGSATDPGTAVPDDGLTLAWAVYKDGSATAYATGDGASWSFTPDDNGNYKVVLTATDKDGDSTAAEQTIAVANVAPTPTITSIGAVRVEGTSIAVTGAATDPGTSVPDDGLSLAWAVYKNGASTAYATAGGESWSFTPDDNGSYRIVLTATDKDGGSTAVEQTIAVAGVAPTVNGLNGPDRGVRGQTLSYSGSFSDAGSADTWTATVNYGDGTGDQAVALRADKTFALDHVFTAAGSYQVVVTVTDDDGGVGRSASLTVEVGIWALLPDPSGVGTALYVGGTTSSDSIHLNPGSGATPIKLKINGDSWSIPNPPTGSIIVYGQAGDDSIKISGLTQRTVLFGGAGNDTIAAGNGPSVLVGGAGDDTLDGGNDRDLLIGGDGTDTLGGGGGDDILVGGRFAGEADLAALLAIMNEWGSAHDYDTRVGILTGSGPSGSPGLGLLADPTILDDLAADALTGSSGKDLFLAGRRNVVTGLISGEVIKRKS